MDTESRQYHEYLEEFRFLHDAKLSEDYLDEPDAEEGELEAEWLAAAGLEPLTEQFRQGRELTDQDLDPVLRSLAAHQAEAVRKRVRTLNKTVRKRNARQVRGRARKPDIRDVFRDVENSSTGTRSRSATPDSLDSELPCEDTDGQNMQLWPHTPSHQFYHPRTGSQEWEDISRSPPRVYGRFISPYPVEMTRANVPRSQPKEVVRREPSIPIHDTPDMFSHPGAWRGSKGSLASDNEGVKILNYQVIGTMHLPRPKERIRTGSETVQNDDHNNNRHYLSPHKQRGYPSKHYTETTEKSKTSNRNNHVSLTRSHSNLYTDMNNDNDFTLQNQRSQVKSHLRRSGSIGQIGFEEICLQNQNKIKPFANNTSKLRNPVGRTCIDYLGDEDLQRLRPLLLLEVTALLDKYNISFNKRKTPKKKRKEDGLVFGVSLSSLLEKDHQLTGEDIRVPLIFQKLLQQLEQRGLGEEGLLRVAGLQPRVEALVTQIEADFYRQPETVDSLLTHVGPHELSALLKRLLRDLPQPLLSAELTDMFYQSHALPSDELRNKALNLLVLLLPPECRETLRALFTFLSHVVHNQTQNKMSLHNVAMIIAPSLFSPRYVHPVDKSDLTAQVNMAAICCRLTESMLQCGQDLWVVPEPLVAQVRRQNEEERYRKGHKENSKPMKRFLVRKGAIREPIARKIDNEVDYQDGVIRVNAPQFQMSEIPVQLLEDTTAKDVVLRIVEEASKRPDLLGNGLKPPRKHQSRALSELAPNGNLSCILATGYPELTLQTHFLYEVGGNLAQRQLEHNANLLAVYKENPNAQWTLRCHHRNAINT